MFYWTHTTSITQLLHYIRSTHPASTDIHKEIEQLESLMSFSLYFSFLFIFCLLFYVVQSKNFVCTIENTNHESSWCASIVKRFVDTRRREKRNADIADNDIDDDEKRKENSKWFFLKFPTFVYFLPFFTMRNTALILCALVAKFRSCNCDIVELVLKLNFGFRFQGKTHFIHFVESVLKTMTLFYLSRIQTWNL